MVSTFVLTPPSHGDTAQVVVAAADPVAENRRQAAAPTDPEGTTCSELKRTLASAGSLTILSGRGWGDTFYGPGVPQCQFWARPVFSYVRTRDGLCGVGYICVEKLGAAGGGR